MDRLAPYLCDLHRDWLAGDPGGARHREQDGSLLFLDISGFTPLTERLARNGKVGVEQLTDMLNGVVAPLVQSAGALGGDTLKFGGDAVLVLFTHDGHERRAAAAAFDMQRAMEPYRRIKIGAGMVSLRASAAVASGPVHHFLVGEPVRELVVAGPTTSAVIGLEGDARPGEVLLAAPTCAALESRCRPVERGDGVAALAARPDARRSPQRSSALGQAARGLSAALHDHLGPETENEHRQVTVGFAQFRGLDDLLAGAGQIAVAGELHALMVRVAGACEDYGVTFLGTDVDRGAGKVVLVSGAPTASIDDADRMLFALREIVAHEGALRVRAGVHRGRVFAVHLGTPQRCVYTMIGDATNLAARVMGNAPDGEVLATSAVLDRARAPFSLVAVAPFAVRGRRALVDAALVGAPGVAATRQPADTLLAGRDAELAVLRDAIASARGGTGQIAEVVGEAGIGKSRLVAEVAADAVRSGWRVVVAQTSTYDRATPYAALRDPLRALLDPRDGSDAELIYALTAMVRRHLPGSRGLLPLIALAFGLRLSPTKQSSRMSSQVRRTQLHYLVDRLLAAILRPRETLLIVEDAQWLDEASTDLLDTLLRRAGERAWAVLITRRPGSDALAELPVRCLRIDLKPLSDDASRALVRAAGATLRPHVAAALVERSHGNPLFLHELIAAAGRCSDADELPTTIETLLTARIDTLLPVDRRLLRRAAVLGQRFELSLLRAMVDEPEDELREALDRLEDFLQVERGIVRFRQALHRETAYEALPFKRRRELHVRAGVLIERRLGVGADEAADILAMHFLCAHDHTRAYSYARAAAEQARERGAHADAAALYGRAIEAARALKLSHDELACLWEAQGEANMWSGDLAAAHDAFTHARRHVSGDACRESRLIHCHARAAIDGGQIVRAARWLLRGMRLLDAIVTPEADACRATLLAELAGIRTRQGRFSEAIALCQRAIADAGSAAADAPLAHAYHVLDWALGEAGRADEAVHSQPAPAIYRGVGDLDREAAVLNNLGMQAHLDGRWDEAVALYRRSVEAATRAGNLTTVAFGDCNVGELRADQGREDEARTYLLRALDVWRATGYEYGVAFATALLGRLDGRAGQLERALGQMQVALREFRSLRLSHDAAWVETLVPEALVHSGHPSEAIAHTERLLGCDGRRPSALLHRVHAIALAQLGRVEPARAALSAALCEADEQGEEFERVLALDVLDALGGRGANADDGPGRQRDTIVQRLDIARLPPLPLVRTATAPRGSVSEEAGGRSRSRT